MIFLISVIHKVSKKKRKKRLTKSLVKGRNHCAFNNPILFSHISTHIRICLNSMFSGLPLWESLAPVFDLETHEPEHTGNTLGA